MNDHDHNDVFDQGLLHDLRVLNQLADRRRVLRWLASASLVPIVGCSGTSLEDDGSAGTAGSAGSRGGASGAAGSGVGEAGADVGGGAAGEASAMGGGGNGAGGAAEAAGAGGAGGADCSKIPQETAGPYPGDGSNGPQILTASGVVRDDITTSFGSFSGTAAGIPLTVRLRVVSASGCGKLAGAAVYIWHCDRDGNYSMYTVSSQNYLRGVQEADSDGVVTFKTIFPACYSGRWPHIHFEIFKSLELATAAGQKLGTSQLALPKAACDEVFATTGYEKSVKNLSQISLTSDMVFSDGVSNQLASVTGSVSAGYLATLTIAV